MRPLAQNLGKELKQEKEINTMRIDLFLLHDDKFDDNPRKCIMASGKDLKAEINKYIDQLISEGWTKRKLTFYFIKKLGFSEATCDSLVYLRKEFYHLIFLKKLLLLSNAYNKRFELQDKIKYLKANQTPLRVFKAVKFITPGLCKLAGAHAADGTLHDNYFCVTDGQKSNIIAFSNWFTKTFDIHLKVKSIPTSTQEWKVATTLKVYSRYLTHVLNFPNGSKTEIVKMSQIIKNSPIKMQIAFANGFMTFESGFGIKNEVELCVLSKNIIDDLEKVFDNSNVKFVRMKKKSGKYYRIWSGKLNKTEAKNWLKFFEKDTYKYNRLLDFAAGYSTIPKTFEEAIEILDKAFPKKPNNKTCLVEILHAIRRIRAGTRHDLKSAAGLKDFGGPWNGSLRPYITILELTNIINTKIGKANGKSCQIYEYNPSLEIWRLPSTEVK